MTNTKKAKSTKAKKAKSTKTPKSAKSTKTKKAKSTNTKKAKSTNTKKAKSTKTKTPKSAKTVAETVLVLRTCDKDLKAYGGFQWPSSGPVSCPDWDPSPRCGSGLHGLLSGLGKGELLSFAADAMWLVVEVLAAEIVVLDDSEKVKFPRGRVVFCGDRRAATEYLNERKPGAITGLIATVGYEGTATAGDHGTATAGDHGTATAGYRGTATAGDHGTATAGDSGTAVAGYRGKATAGYCGTATAGNHGTATAGNAGTATVGYEGTATAGDHGILVLRWHDGTRCRVQPCYVGEDGIEANTAYRLDKTGAIAKVQK